MIVPPRVSVIVCTRNRAAVLERALASLLADRSTVSREILVVDNGSSDRTREVVAAAGEPVRYAQEPTPGLSRARNAGVAAARGELLFFTDDDVEVEDGWTDGLAAAFDDPAVVAAGGRILPRWPCPPPAWLDGPHAVPLTVRDLGVEPRHLGVGEAPFGGNFGVRRSALAGLGSTPFEPSLGYVDGRLRGGEEFDLVQRLRARGSIAYRPDAVLHHLISADRMTWTSLRSAWFHGGFAIARVKRRGGAPLPSVPRRAWRALRAYRVARSVRRRNRRAEPTATGAWEEFRAYASAGRSLEFLFGRFPRLSDGVARALERLEGRLA